jgi:hypothetical protein
MQSRLRFDPIPSLLAEGDEALCYFVRRDLLGEKVEPLRQFWELLQAQKLFRKQQPDGSWSFSGKQKHPAINYSLIETWKQFRLMIEKFGCNREHPPTAKAAEFLFSCQTEAGDIRGFLANQYAPYYTGAILSLLIQAGYEDDPRVELGMQWLLSMRQDDLGWTIPLITHSLDRETQYRLTSQYAESVETDRAKPFSHNWTGMVLRAFAAHSCYRCSEPAQIAAEHLILQRRFLWHNILR